MNLINVIISGFIGYMFGCIQTAYLVGKFAGKIDIRKHGTNNAGASNVTTVLGWKYGILTAVVDILKASAAIILVRRIFPGVEGLAFTAGTFAIIGHIFPFFLKFKGGKGAASLIGMFIAIDIKIAVILVLTILILTLVIDYIAVGSIAMFTAAPVATYFWGFPLEATLLCILLALICYYKHYINIIRIMKGEEIGLRSIIKKNRNKNNVNI
jgi:acyl phosphate:glycerol-3-phosphate acyltransferase